MSDVANQESKEQGPTSMRKYVVEFIGTFFLMLTIGMTVIKSEGAGILAPVAIGSILMVMVFAGGHISGGHYNPAVTLGAWLRGRTDSKDVPGYMIAQTIGALIAAFLVIWLETKPDINIATPDVPRWLVAEFVFTFALVYVVINSAMAKGTEGNSFYGLAIGFTVLAGAYAVGPITGAAFNPAAAVGVCILGLVPWSSLWIFLVANLAGGAAAALAFKALNPDDV